MCYSPHQCTCGELKLCDKACYCDGSQTDASTMDEARVVDKSNLPIMSIDFAQGQSDKGRVDVESLMCSSEPIGKSWYHESSVELTRPP